MAKDSSHKKFIKKILGSKVALFFVVLALIALTINLGRESYRKHQLNNEINKLQAEIDKSEKRNKQLADLMEYFKEESHLEKEARLKLNLKKPGERVVILRDSQINGTSSNDLDNNQEDDSSKEKKNNWWQWWEYFFGQQN